MKLFKRNRIDIPIDAVKIARRKSNFDNEFGDEVLFTKSPMTEIPRINKDNAIP